MPLVYTTIQHAFRKQHGLTCNEYVLADMIYKLSTRPDAKIKDWCFMSRPEMANELGVSKQTVLNLIDSLVEKGHIEKDPQTSFLKSTPKWNVVYFTDGKESLPPTALPSVKNLYPGGKESLPYNNNIINSSIVLSESPNDDQTENKKNSNKWIETFDKRLDDFKNSLYVFTKYPNNKNGIYEKDMVKSFFDYWSEPNKSRSRMRWETEKTWDLSKRLNYWNNNSLNNKKNNGQPRVRASFQTQEYGEVAN